MRIFLLLLFLVFSIEVNSKRIDNDSIVKHCCYDDYMVSFKTYYIQDSVQTNELLMQNPTVVRQTLSIFIDKEFVKNIVISNRQINVCAKDNSELVISQIPILDLSIVKGTQSYYLFLYGALNCCGTGCPEYFGIYDLQGNKITEFISTEHNDKYRRFNKFVGKNKIDLDKSLSKVSILDELIREK